VTPTFRVTWLVGPAYDMHGSSSLVAGLGELSRSGQIELRLEIRSGPPLGPHLIRLDLQETATGRRKKVCFEGFDRADRFDMEALREVDVYFKQTLDRTCLGGLEKALAARVLPAGLTYSARFAGTRSLFLRAAGRSFAARLGQHGLSSFPAGLRQLWDDAQEVYATLSVADWERHESDVSLPSVVYQTRLWSADRMPERARINQFRCALVAALREAFGSEDRIGLLPFEPAMTEARDLVLARKVSRLEYARQLRTSLISVNSHGLDGSPGFKIGEALAAGAAIVSQRLQFELPEPLLPEVHYLPYETPSECVDQCRRLLADFRLVERIRAANLDYYNEHVRPDAFASRLFERAFARAAGGGVQDEARGERPLHACVS
jgi:hypothetical protein